jgi:phosphatidylglycerol lysyltransferase
VSKGIALVTPRVLTCAAFFSGIVLLVSGATPASGIRLAWLGRLLPVGMLELSHFLASLCGVGLLFLARGLQLRLNVAWAATLCALIAGAVFSLVKGLDYEEATLLLLAAGGLAASRRYFHRQSSLWDQRFSPGWLVAIGAVLVGTVWIGFFAYKHVEYSSELWWQFEVSGNAPRFLRASVGVALVVMVVGLTRLFRAARHPTPLPQTEDLEAAMKIAGEAPVTGAHLVALGDKALLFSESRRSFLMYGTSGRCWVAMGDPVGEEGEAEELVWAFREQCEAAGAWTVFYEVAASRLSLYVDLGMSLFKLGEEARVDLRTFTLEGGRRKGLRRTLSKLEADGCRFLVWEPAEVAARLPELQAVSDAWLKDKQSREKGFSLGSFSPGYVVRFPAGVVLLHDRPVAFATLWPGGQREELSVDLMRYRADAPPATMEYLFIQLILQAKEQGYHWFNLGMAPFSGIEHHPLAPLWNRLGALLYRHGEHFYNFQGLRQYKEKFDPVWEPKYLACRGGLILPRVLTDVGALVSGGISGMIRK